MAGDVTAASASWPTRDLVGSLARAGWGPLDGRPMGGCRAVLRALVDLLPYGSGEGSATVGQVADLAGLSAKWTRRCLRVLDALGIITHRVGHVTAGQPKPGHVRINKRTLAGLVRGARSRLDERRRTRAAATRSRLDAAGLVTWFPPRTPRVTPSPVVVPCGTEFHPPTSVGREPGRVFPPAPVANGSDMTHTCIHRIPDANQCALCRRMLREDLTLDVRKLWQEQPDVPVVLPRGGWRALVRAHEQQQTQTQTRNDDGQGVLL